MLSREQIIQKFVQYLADGDLRLSVDEAANSIADITMALSDSVPQQISNFLLPNLSVAWVVPNGNDTTAEVGNTFKPFATLLAAKNSDAKVIYVSGDYSVTFAAGDTLCGKKWIFDSCTITHAGTPLFADTVGVQTIVRGELNIITTNKLIELTNPESSFDMECNSIQSDSGNPIVFQSNVTNPKLLRIVANTFNCTTGNGVVLGGQGGDRTGLSRGTIYISASVWISNWWEYVTGYKNYDITIKADKKTFATAMGGGIDIGYGLDNCTVDLSIERYISDRFGVLLAGQVSNCDIVCKITNGYAKGLTYGVFTVAINNALHENTKLLLHSSNLWSDNLGATAVLSLGNHAGITQSDSFKFSVKNCELRSVGVLSANAPIFLGGNNKLSLDNVYIANASTTTKAVERGHGNNDGTPTIYARNVTANKTVDSTVTVVGTVTTIPEMV